VIRAAARAVGAAVDAHHHGLHAAAVVAAAHDLGAAPRRQRRVGRDARLESAIAREYFGGRRCSSMRRWSGSTFQPMT
jgi:hypothetical protein